MFRFVWLSVLLCALALGGAGCKKKVVVTPSTGPVRIGMELNYPPFEMTDEQGKPIGISVDMAHALGEHLGRPVEITNLPFDGLIPSLKTGKIDLIISSLTVTPERAESIAFSEPYIKTGLAVLFSSKSGVKDLNDLKQPNRIVAVKKGTTGYFYAAKHFPNPLVLDQESACVLEVVNASADAFLYDQLSILRHWQANRFTTRAALEPLQQESWAIGLRQGEEELRGKLNEFIAKYRAEGGFQRLGDRYLLKEKTAFAEMGIPFIF